MLIFRDVFVDDMGLIISPLLQCDFPNFRGPASVLVPQPIVLVARGLTCDACHGGRLFTKSAEINVFGHEIN